jgi:enolase
VPSGASTGEREALELRDGDTARYGGKGVRKAVANVNGEIAQRVVGRELDQRGARRAMIALDGTPTKSRSAPTRCSACRWRRCAPSAARTAAALPHIGALYGTDALTLPVPMMNILNGGAHADSSVDFQEFMVMPLARRRSRGAADGRRDLSTRCAASSRSAASRPASATRRLRAEPEVEPRGGRGRARGDRQGRLKPGRTSSSRSTSRRASSGRRRPLHVQEVGEPDRTSDEMIALYEDWIRQYPIVSIEDGLAEGDWDGWKR